MISNKLDKNEYNPYYKAYVDLSTDNDIIIGLSQNLESIASFYSSLDIEKHDFAYAEGKWTIKDVLLHCIDTERIFAYRALRIARQDNTPLAGFEQNDYAASVNTREKSLENLLNEHRTVRQSTIALYKSFDADALKQIGEASGFPISVKALGYIITGHENHHINIIKERYL
jgi:hypothetical protein